MILFKRFLFLLPIVSVLFMGCGLFEWEIEKPTKDKMEGIWKVTEAYNEHGGSILEKIAFPVVVFQMQGKNNYLSTAEPMFSYIVYGGSDYAVIASKIDQALDYSKLEVFDGYEWFIGSGVVDRFTLVMKIVGFPGVATVAEILDWLEIQTNIPLLVIYHKFNGIKVTFPNPDNSTMIWEFDDQTEAIYNSKDEEGNDYLFQGVTASNFARCKFVLEKQVKTLKELVKEK